MKRGKIQGIGIIIAIVFTLIMLSFGRITPNSEAQENEQTQQNESKQDRHLFQSEILSIKDDRGNDLETVSFSDEQPAKIYEIDADTKQKIHFIAKVKGNSQANTADLSELIVENLRIETDSPYIGIGFTDIKKFDRKTGIIEGTTAIRLGQYYSDGEERFKLKLVSTDKDINPNQTDTVVATIQTPSQNKQQQSTKNTEVTPDQPVKSEPVGDLADEKITDSNIDDWDGILDQDEIEDYTFEDGLY
ncbi:hypothetical protein [Enterococcus devriesei]|uniref:hypothetical protein n=1 Tax=Enterococcus devriesei TaxID=319970 RepID=UPI0036D3594B